MFENLIRFINRKKRLHFQTTTPAEIKGKYVLKLQQAVEGNHLQEAKRLLKKGTNPDWVVRTPAGVDPPDRTLVRAIKNDSIAMAKLLLYYGASAESGYDLNYAVRECSTDMVDLLISHGANVNARLETSYTVSPAEKSASWVFSGKLYGLGFFSFHTAHHLKRGTTATPLFSAIERGSKTMVEHLIAKGADLNAKASLIETSRDHTLLHYAAAKGCEAIVALLLSKGAEIDAGDSGGRTPLTVACTAGQKAVADLLIANGADLDAKDNFSHTLLHFAAMGGLKEVVELVLAAGADVNAKNRASQTALHFAAGTIGKSSKEIVELLLAEGAHVNASIDATPLHGCRSREVGELLIAKGADLNAKNAKLQTPLHKAIERGNKEIVSLLIAEGAGLKQIDKDGRTPLYRAVQKGDAEMVELLLPRNAEVSAAGLSEVMHGATSELAVLVVNKMAEQLLARCADLNVKLADSQTLLHFATLSVSVEAVQFLVANGADVNARDQDGRSPLYGAIDCAATGNLVSFELAKCLLDNGADINLRYKNERTPLHYLAFMSFRRGSITRNVRSVASWLLRHGADVNAKDMNGKTLLHYMAGRYLGDEVAIEMIKLLVANGADTNVKDKGGRRPLDSARTFGKKDREELLKGLT